MSYQTFDIFLFKFIKSIFIIFVGGAVEPDRLFDCIRSESIDCFRNFQPVMSSQYNLKEYEIALNKLEFVVVDLFEFLFLESCHAEFEDFVKIIFVG